MQKDRWGRIIPTLGDVGERILNLGSVLEQAEAIGVFGSLARGNFSPDKSDIDIFIVVKEKGYGFEISDLWWKRINKALEDFGREVTVLVYSISGLKNISSWYVLRLATEGIIIYDKSGIRELFANIIKAAKEAGLVEEEMPSGRKVWVARGLKFGKVLEVKVR